MMTDLIETAVREETQYGTVIVPDALHHGIIMLLHVAKHMLASSGIGLRHLCDWAMYVDRVDLGQHREPLQSVGLWTFACQLTATCSRYLGLTVQVRAGEWPEDFLQSLMEDILSAGNFGRKQLERGTTLKRRKETFVLSTIKRYNVKYGYRFLCF